MVSFVSLGRHLTLRGRKRDDVTPRREVNWYLILELLLKTFPTFYGNQEFTEAFTRGPREPHENIPQCRIPFVYDPN